MCEVLEYKEKIGEERGEERTIFSLVSKGKLSAQDGAEELKMDIETFNKGLFGYQKEVETKH